MLSKSISSNFLKLSLLLIFSVYIVSLYSFDSHILGKNNICSSDESDSSERTCEENCLSDRDFTSFESRFEVSPLQYSLVNKLNNFKTKNKLKKGQILPRLFIFFKIF